MSHSQPFPGVIAAEPRLIPLQRLSAIMCFIVAIGGALAELLLAWVWWSPDLVETLVVPHIGLPPGSAALDPVSRLSGFAISMLPLGVLFYALHQAYELFDGYRAGNVFSAEAPRRLRRIGLAMLALAALRPLTSALLSMALTAANPAGQRMLAITFSLDDFMIALFGGLIIAIGHVLLEASRLADDHRQII